VTASLTEAQFQRLVAFSAAVARTADRSAIMALAEEAFRQEFGHRLFTLLKIDHEAGLMRRLYSSNTTTNPLGGTKPIEASDWARRVLIEGRPFIGRDRDDLRRVFSDHEALFGIGCESVLNTPVLAGGCVIGSINILDGRDHYRQEMCALASLYGQLLVPVFI
jgi:GAF domain-containing protein